MMPRPKVTDGECSVTVRVPISIRQRGGRKLVLAPDGADVTASPACRHIDNAMVKSIARAFRWREILENGDYATIREIARAEKINETYVGRLLRLTLLAPEIVEVILNGRQPPGLQLDALMQRFPVGWGEQRHLFGVQVAPANPRNEVTRAPSRISRSEPAADQVVHCHLRRAMINGAAACRAMISPVPPLPAGP